MKSKIVLTSLAMSLVAAPASAMVNCELRMSNAATAAYADELLVPVNRLLVGFSHSNGWTEAAANNTGSNTIAVYSRSKFETFKVTGKQKANSDDCTVTKVEKVKLNSSDLRLQAMKYKMAIRDALWPSEGDSEWEIFTSAKVKLPTNFTEKDLQKLVGSEAPVEIYSKKEIDEIIMRGEVSEEEGHLYRDLGRAMKKDFKEINMIKVGEPDGGTLEIYIFGVNPDGTVVGLRAFSVET